MKKAIGVVEYKSIAKGIEATDAMVKSANVEVLKANTICSGKFITFIAGDVGAVKNGVEVGMRVGTNYVVDHLTIPNVHPAVFPALAGSSHITKMSSLGVVETISVASAILSADAAAKAANVDLVEIRCATGLGGKAFLTLTGEVSAVKSAVQSARVLLENEGTLLQTAVISSPHPSLMDRII